MDFTCEVAKAFQLSPFDVLGQDKDNVIMMINYFCEKGDESTTKKDNSKRIVAKKHDGFWDM